MVSNKKKIALFADVLEENFDGVSITLHKILKNAPRDRFEFLVITPHPPKDTSAIPFEILVCRYLALPLQQGYRLGFPGHKTKNALANFQPDLIHFTSPSLLGRFAVKYGERNDIPILNIYHTHYPSYLKYYVGRRLDAWIGLQIKQKFAWYYKHSDLSLIPTSPIKRDLIEIGVPAEKMKIWGRAVDTSSFSSQHRDENLFEGSISKDSKKVLFVSRLIKEKDMPFLVKIYEETKKSTTKATFVITGDGPKRKWLEKRMTTAIFTGKKTGKELASIYASCDVFIFPSSTETFGNVVIEAMASGLPVVSVDAGGPSEIVKNGENGYLIEQNDPRAFASRIIEILNNDTLRKDLSEKATSSVKTRSIESLHEELWGIYDEVIDQYASKKEVKNKQDD